MVKKREPAKKVNKFVSKGDDSPKAPRNYKSITLPFNKYEYESLIDAVDNSDRSSINDWLRLAIREQIKRQ